MKKKNLLSESQIRRMMKFANIEPLSENFFDRQMTEDDGMEDEMEDEMGGMEEPMDDMEEPMDDMEEPMDDMDAEAAPMDDMGGEMDAEAAPMDDMDDSEEAMLEIFGDKMDSIDEEDALEEGFNEATPSNPGKGMTPQGNNKTKAAPYKGFTENNGEEPGKGGHKLSDAPKPSLNKNKNSYGPTGDQETDKEPPMATNEVKQLKESIAAVVRRMLKERRAKK